MQIIGKKYRREGVQDIFEPANIDSTNDFVIFTNNARCKLSTFFKEFTEVAVDGSIVTESNSSTTSSFLNDDVVNPDSFFKDPVVDVSVLQQLETLNTNSSNLPSKRRYESAEVGSGENFKDLSNPRPVDVPANYQERAPTPMEMLQSGTKTQASESIELGQQQNNKQKSNRLPEWDTFDRIKKTEEVELTIPIKIRLPKAQKIDALNDMFESSFISYMAKMYVENEVTGKSKNLQLQIQQQIEQWIDSELYSKTNKKKKAPIKKSIASKKKRNDMHGIVRPKKDGVETFTSSSSSEMNASTFFGGTAPTIWDGDIEKLESIGSDEQAEIVKDHIADLKKLGETDSPEYERLALMLMDWNLLTGK